MESQFEPKTINYLNKTNISYRKSKGQYFTPRDIREKLLSCLPKNTSGMKILDPGCGTGEFLLSAKKYFNEPELYGWDIDGKLIDIAKTIVPGAKLECLDALGEKAGDIFDLVIGNPPYYEFKPDRKIKEKYGDIIGGRTNIFGLFIKLGLELLKDDGYLAYVLPPSMNNGAYFEKLREYIIAHSNIEHLEILKSSDLFHKAQQLTMIMVLKKGPNRGDYVFKKNGITIFSEKKDFLENSFKGKLSLHELGFEVRTGRLVWNQHKSSLSDDPKKGIPLIWSHNITGDRTVKLAKKKKKPQYVKTGKGETGPVIVVNRITGAARSAVIRAAIVPKGMKFIAENHCNVIYPPKKNSAVTLDYLLEQLRSPGKLDVMRSITGNTQISKTELEFLFPVDKPDNLIDKD